MTIWSMSVAPRRGMRSGIMLFWISFKAWLRREHGVTFEMGSVDDE